MKSHIFLASLILLSTSSNCQVYKFKTIQTCINTDPRNTIKESDWENVEILVVINFDKNKIKTFGKKEGDYDLILKTKEYTNNDGNSVIVYSAVDGNGDKCNTRLTIFKEPESNHIATLSVEYPDVFINFRLRKDD